MDEKSRKIVVVGGGVGGLSTGILLASHGAKVVLVEQHSVLGGYLQGFSRGGVRFETGLHYVGACLPGQAFARYLSLLGVYNDLTFLPSPDGVAGNVILPGGRRIATPLGLDAYAAAAKAQFPGEEAGIEAILGEIRHCLHVMPWLNLRQKISDLAAYHAYTTTSADAMIRARVNRPELIAFLSAPCFSTAMLPTECPFALYAITTCTMLAGGCAIRGGGREFIRVLRDRFESLGGQILLGNGARSVTASGNDIKALVLEDGTALDLDVLVSTCHPCETMRFVGREKFSRSFVENLDTLEMSNGSFKLYVELSRPVPALGADRWILCDSEWPGGIYLAAPSALDPSYGDRHCLDILVWQSFAQVEQWQNSRRGERPAEYEAFKRSTADRLLQRVAREFPEIPGAIKHCHVSTPLTNLDYVRSARGSAMGVRQDIRQQGKRRIRPHNRLHNLFLAGQSVGFPGILGTVAGATEVCSAILEKSVDLFSELQEHSGLAD